MCLFKEVFFAAGPGTGPARDDRANRGSGKGWKGLGQYAGGETMPTPLRAFW